METRDTILQGILDSIATKQALLEQTSEIDQIAASMLECYQAGGKVLIFGNGGSAADAQHIAAELVGRFGFDRPGLPALALTVDTSCLTAIANDYSYDSVFARQVQALGKAGDWVLGISTSGNSKNVVNGLMTAKEMGMTTVGFTGRSGGKMKMVADYCLCVPSNVTARIQESHLLVAHLCCEIVEESLFAHLKPQQRKAA